VSILKPVCGLDDGLEENLRSFLALRDVDYEVIVSVADENDPALPLVRSVLEDAPAGRMRLLIGGIGGAKNRKVERLAVAFAEASGEILLVSDSNVRVEPDFLARTIAVFDDPGVGCASNLFTGSGARSLGARLESLHLLLFVAAGNVLAAWSNRVCVVGKSMALRRETLERIGGFGRFNDVLAEDQAIGLAVAAAGYRVALSPTVVRNVTVNRSVRAALARQVRWNRIRVSFSPLLYAAELLMNPLPLAIGTASAAGALGAIAPVDAASGAAAVALLRCAQAGVLAAATGARLSPRDLLLVPLQDLLQFAGQFAPLISRRVEWRGHRARLGPGTLILDEEPASAAA
jgi:ceramide glucosyltransferase